MRIGTRLFVGFGVVLFLTVAIAIVCIVLTIKVGHSGVLLGERKAPLGDAAMEIKLTATTAHLVFEEIIAGDDTENIDEVWDLLEETRWYADAILSGGSNDEGTFYATDQDEVRAAIQRVKTGLASFVEAAHSRYDQRTASSGTGSDADQRFDETYEALVTALGEVAQRFENLGGAEAAATAYDTRFRLADAHLFLEEHLSGDETVSRQLVGEKFDAARANLVELSARYPSLATPLVDDIDELISAAESRMQTNASSVRAGSGVEVSFDNSFDAFIRDADIAEELIHDSMDSELARLVSRERTSTTVIAAMAGLAILAAIFVAVSTTRRITRRLFIFQDLFGRGAGGDLRVRAERLGSDELGELGETFNAFMAALTEITTKLKENSADLTTAGESLRNRSEEARSIVNQIDHEVSTSKEMLDLQSANVTQTSAAIEETARNIESLDRIVVNQVASVTESAASVEEMIASITTIASRAEMAVANISELESLSAQGQEMMSESIGLVTNVAQMSEQLNEANDVVAGISAQTNLLAMNAAIEAAHAGEAGKGFSVVADEIRKLAESSSTQSRDVDTNLKKIRTAIETVVRSSEDTNSILQQIISTIRETVQVITEITTALDEQRGSGKTVLSELERMTEMSQTVQAGSSEMRLGNDEIVKATQQLNDVTGRFNSAFSELEAQKNNVIGAVEVMGQAATQMQSVAVSVDEIVQFFTVDDEQNQT